jgi:predicted dehydrogenase
LSLLINVGICGLGYWGPNLLRNFAANPNFRPVAIAERREVYRTNAAILDPNLRVYEDAADLIDDPEIDAVAIATPVSSHFELARRALARFKHVLVEKPMCASVAEGEELVALAKRTRRTLMVDHTYLFHGAVQKLRELKKSGALGVVSYFDSVRINLGLFQPDMNVLWDLAPHDYSIMDHLFGEEPIHLEASGYCHLNPHLPDIAYITMHFPSQMIAHFHLSWMSPVKVRRIAIGGTNQMAVWDDLNQDEKLKIYDSGIEIQPEAERRTLVPSYRIGDVLSPRISNHEPLTAVVEHFCRGITREEASPLSGQHGLRIVRLLERTQTALDASLAKLFQGREVLAQHRVLR